MAKRQRSRYWPLKPGSAEYQRARIADKRSRGECTFCAQQAAPGHVFCELHLKDQARRSNEVYHRRIREQRCTVCGDKLKTPKVRRCDLCRKKAIVLTKELRADWLQRGICLSCGTRPAAPGLKNCGQCLADQRRREARRKQLAQRRAEFRGLKLFGDFWWDRGGRANGKGEASPRQRPAKTGNRVAEGTAPIT